MVSKEDLIKSLDLYFFLYWIDFLMILLILQYFSFILDLNSIASITFVSTLQVRILENPWQTDVF